MRGRILLALSILLTGCFLIGPGSNMVGTNIGREVRDKKVKHIDIAKLTNFPWDDIYVFGPYQRRVSICESLKLEASTCTRLIRKDVDEGETLLVFRNKNEIVHVERHRRYFGDFAVSAAHNPIQREDAKFLVEQSAVAYDGKPWYKLVLAKNPDTPLNLDTDGSLRQLP